MDITTAIAGTHSGVYYFFAVLFYLVLAVSLTCHILLHKEDVKAAIGWIALVWLTPVLGGIIYVILGINRVRRRARKLRHHNYKKDFEFLKKKVPPEIAAKLKDEDLTFFKLGMNIHPEVMRPGHIVTPLVNGDQAYPEMLRLINGAKREVLLTSYIFDGDSIGEKFCAALTAAAQRGVRVRVMLDAVGIGKWRRKVVQMLSTANKNLQYAFFLPTKSPVKLPFINLRNHRKILVVDGEAAVFGGMNISAPNILAENHPDAVQDITFKIEGPVITKIGSLFLQDWFFTTHRRFKPLSYQGKTITGGAYCRLIPDGPDEDFGKIELLFLAALNSAAKTINIVTPYFLPNETVLVAVEMAAMRGVEVNLILPKKSDQKIFEWAPAANYERLLAKGVNIYHSQEPFDHSKVFVIDGVWSIIGSANWDERSFKLNFEACIECLSKDFGAQMDKYAHAKIKESAPQTLAHYKALPTLKKLRNKLFRLLTPYF
ncbi:cardiolipin synthase [Elusimicrobium simillimum]|uniref:phospholipase D-like domain-containing protein n=1 Tax=Elusimicrobium simillimum TaxID=3143438 RepID=UPI003C704165